jgi:type I restriction enzyme S subunit
MPRTDWNALSQFPVKVPEGSKLSEFNSVVVPALKKINYNLEQLRTLEKLRDTLLPKLMSGEVRVQHDG